MNGCIRISDPVVFNLIQSQLKWVQTAILTRVNELKESKELTGIPVGSHEYIAVTVIVTKINDGNYYSTTEWHIVKAIKYRRK